MAAPLDENDGEDSEDDSEGEEGGFFFGSRAKTSEVCSILRLEGEDTVLFLL